MISASSFYHEGRWRVTLTDTETGRRRIVIVRASDVALLALTRPILAALWMAHDHDGSTWTQDAPHATNEH